LLFLLSCALKIWQPYSQVFTDSGVLFVGADSWYHMRRMDFLLANFPSILVHDPYAFFPGGQTVGVAPLFDWLVVSIAVLLGASADVGVLETTAAFAPPVMGSLVIVPLYLATKTLFNRQIALLAAALLAVQSGPYLLRTTLGFVDHHAAEVLFSCITMALLFLASTSTEAVAKTRRFSLAAGIALGAYCLSWSGASLIVAVISVWVCVQACVGFEKPKYQLDLISIVGPCAVVALLLLLPFWEFLPRRNIHLTALILMVCLPWLMQLNARFASKTNSRRWVFYGLISFQVIVALSLFKWLYPGLWHSVLTDMGRFSGQGIGNTVAESTPLLTMSGQWSLWPVIDGFGWLFFLGLAGFGIVLLSMWKEYRADRSLLLIWCFAMSIVALGQNRFGYYLAVNLSILGAIVCLQILALGFSGLRQQVSETERGMNVQMYRLMAVFIVVGIAFLPPLQSALAMTRTMAVPTQTWVTALNWLRNNTPEPFGDNTVYTDPVKLAHASKHEAAYGVLAWWDYGYWITRIGRRVPNANPTQSGAGKVAGFLLAVDPQQGEKLLRTMGSRYVIVDSSLMFYINQPTKFPAIVAWAGRETREFFEWYYQVGSDGSSTPVLGIKPNYYKTMLARLFYFSAKQVSPESSWVYQYEWHTGQSGEKYKRLIKRSEFSSYSDAEAYIKAHPDRALDLVCTTPSKTCIPIKAMKNFSEVYRSGFKVKDDKGRVKHSLGLRIFSTGQVQE